MTTQLWVDLLGSHAEGWQSLQRWIDEREQIALKAIVGAEPGTLKDYEARGELKAWATIRREITREREERQRHGRPDHTSARSS